MIHKIKLNKSVTSQLECSTVNMESIQAEFLAVGKSLLNYLTYSSEP